MASGIVRAQPSPLVNVNFIGRPRRPAVNATASIWRLGSLRLDFRHGILRDVVVR